ncbi:MAG: ankyrin repeat domain-containing protein [Victivallales bacterium]|nr:ankyrin repeat domain-containing protein [Victivallales bacterium]
MQKHKRIEEGSLEYQLLECCRNGSLEEVRALLDAVVAADAGLPNIYEREELLDGYSIVHMAAENPDIRIIKLLVERGADVNVTDSYANTPLYYAARRNTLEMVWYLVSLGNDPLWENADGDNLLTVSACNPHKDVLEYFLHQGVDIDGVSDIIPLGKAMRDGTPEDIDFFLTHGADREYALTSAYCCAPLENIRYLLEKGCNVNACFDILGNRLDWTKLPEDPLRQLFLEYGAKSDEELAKESKIQ